MDSRFCGNDNKTMNLPLPRLGTPVLRQKSLPVPESEINTPAFQKYIDDLIDTMRANDGVGIASVQAGIPKAVFVIEAKGNRRYPGAPDIPLQVFINPSVEILKAGDETDWEGCLSVPGLRGQVPRAKKVRIKALSRTGAPVDIEASGFFARVIQHEWDHLQGNVYLDRMQGLQTLTFLEEFARYWSK